MRTVWYVLLQKEGLCFKAGGCLLFGGCHAPDWVEASREEGTLLPSELCSTWGGSQHAGKDKTYSTREVLGGWRKWRGGEGEGVFPQHRAGPGKALELTAEKRHSWNCRGGCAWCAQPTKLLERNWIAKHNRKGCLTSQRVSEKELGSAPSDKAEWHFCRLMKSDLWVQRNLTFR